MMVVAGLLLLLAFQKWGRNDSPASRHHVVDIRALAFDPAQLVVESGDTVIWINHDIFPHTVTPVDAATPDSTAMSMGDTVLMVMSNKGDMRYFCLLHPSMTGMVTTR